MRRITLCADDYGIAPGVNKAICDLIGKDRLNATSVMVVAPSLTAAEADELAVMAAGRAEIGLHITLTGAFAPLTDYAPLQDGHYPEVGAVLIAALLRRLDTAKLKAEIEAQFMGFAKLFGRPPDFVDGHQHVHLFPQVRNVVLAAVRAFAPGAWVRQCGAVRPLPEQLGDPKGMLISSLSRTFRAAARRTGVATNPAFAGTYTYRDGFDFARAFPGFLEGLPDGGLVMCHPGLVDDELVRRDPLTTLRETEYAYFASAEFPAMLTAKGVHLS